MYSTYCSIGGLTQTRTAHNNNIITAKFLNQIVKNMIIHMHFYEWKHTDNIKCNLWVYWNIFFCIFKM